MFNQKILNTMIGQSIQAVYQRDKKVFIPEFGAFFYSEATNRLDFNDLLTFDDGKIIREIQKQQTLSEEEARSTLDKYVQKIRNILEYKKSYLFEGIGTLVKQEDGTLAIDRNEDASGAAATFEGRVPEPIDIHEHSGPKHETDSLENYADTSQQIDSQRNDDFRLTQNSRRSEPVRKKKPPVQKGPAKKEPVNKTLHYNPFLSDADENVQEYYRRKEKYHKKLEKRNPLVTALWFIIPIVLLALAALYYFKYDQINAYVARFQEYNIFDGDRQRQANASSPSARPANPESNVVPGNSDTPGAYETGGNTSDKAVKTIEDASKSKISSTDLYSLVLGSFKNEENANQLIIEWKNRGLDEVDKFQGSNGYFFVGIENIEGKNKANELLSSVRQKEPSAWIMKKK
ncbi:MAG: SPOR domain-containing protein [Cytophagales bacterium]|nr:SPOR domain-containing protein [Cytophagales bacterium]